MQLNQLLQPNFDHFGSHSASLVKKFQPQLLTFRGAKILAASNLQSDGPVPHPLYLPYFPSFDLLVSSFSIVVVVVVIVLHFVALSFKPTAKRLSLSIFKSLFEYNSHVIYYSINNAYLHPPPSCSCLSCCGARQYFSPNAHHHCRVRPLYLRGSNVSTRIFHINNSFDLTPHFSESSTPAFPNANLKLHHALVTIGPVSASNTVLS
jgi:hypothetical protein